MPTRYLARGAPHVAFAEVLAAKNAEVGCDRGESQPTFSDTEAGGACRVKWIRMGKDRTLYPLAAPDRPEQKPSMMSAVAAVTAAVVIAAVAAMIVARRIVVAAAVAPVTAIRRGRERARQQHRTVLRDRDVLAARIEIERKVTGFGRIAEFDLAFGAALHRHDIDGSAIRAAHAQCVRAGGKMVKAQLPKALSWRALEL